MLGHLITCSQCFGGVLLCAMGLFDKQEKNTFCYFECFGVVKVAWLGLVEPEVSKMEYFCLKKKLSMLDRTVTTPNIK